MDTAWEEDRYCPATGNGNTHYHQLTGFTTCMIMQSDLPDLWGRDATGKKATFQQQHCISPRNSKLSLLVSVRNPVQKCLISLEETSETFISPFSGLRFVVEIPSDIVSNVGHANHQSSVMQKDAWRALLQREVEGILQVTSPSCRLLDRLLSRTRFKFLRC